VRIRNRAEIGTTPRRNGSARRGKRAYARKGIHMQAQDASPAGRYGIFGGRYAPEVLMPALLELEQAFLEACEDPAFQGEFETYLRDYAGRETPLTFAGNLSRSSSGARIYLKREDLLHTGAHKINNTLGQALLARRMGRKRLIAETGAGQHGVATATVAALFGMECRVFMGTEDIQRQSLNVARMKLLGADVVPVESGTCTLKEAMNEAMRNWASCVRDTHYVVGTVAGPHPYPLMVRWFQQVIGFETRRQIREKEGRLPDLLVACVGGGSNAIGLFHPFLNDPDVRMLGVEAGGHGLETGLHAASLTGGSIGVLHGCKTYVLQDEEGQIRNAHSISAGLDYPGVGPEHGFLYESGRVRYAVIRDREALDAARWVARCEGIIPALESAHALAWVRNHKDSFRPGQIVVICLSGRGDKDMNTISRELGLI